VRRNIHHPYFKNLSRTAALKFLQGEEVGEFVMRPSNVSRSARVSWVLKTAP
jgi:hypothetical protein